jgi:hypothetical protein
MIVKYENKESKTTYEFKNGKIYDLESKDVYAPATKPHTFSAEIVYLVELIKNPEELRITLQD